LLLIKQANAKSLVYKKQFMYNDEEEKVIEKLANPTIKLGI